eukprot:13536875-Alexandrium_andersonii.AAC.1
MRRRAPERSPPACCRKRTAPWSSPAAPVRRASGGPSRTVSGPGSFACPLGAASRPVDRPQRRFRP